MASPAQALQSASGNSPQPAPVLFDTIEGSFLHYVAGYRADGQKEQSPSVLKTYLAAVAVTWLPLLICALLGPHPVWRPVGSLKLPFLWDVNINFMFLITFPAILVLLTTDQGVLASSLRRVQIEGVLSISPDVAQALAARWARLFRTINLALYASAVFFGLISAWLNATAYLPDIGFWCTGSTGLLFPLGYVFSWCVFAFFAVLYLLVTRSLAIAFFLHDLVKHSTLRLLPFHPDGSGGLRPVGRLGLRTQYGLTVCGLSVLLFEFVSSRYFGSPGHKMPVELWRLILANGIGYIIFGPLVFISPLLPFRGGMRRTKSELLSEVAQRLRVELERLRIQLTSGAITKDDEELIDRLRKLGTVISPSPSGLLMSKLSANSPAPT